MSSYKLWLALVRCGAVCSGLVGSGLFEVRDFESSFIFMKECGCGMVGYDGLCPGQAG